jgi:O-acetylhomoserine (thiol)-lyase
MEQILLFILDKKYIGNGTSLGGVIIDSGTFDWVVVVFLNSTPNAGYHGLVYHEALGMPLS